MISFLPPSGWITNYTELAFHGLSENSQERRIAQFLDERTNMQVILEWRTSVYVKTHRDKRFG